ncbi:SAF domain-containing protein [Spirillospora sp. NBC_01491]|uniref:SAF domain-containing protein n=1 Tax=Spirillospora sp. NBC_01491 TaxID=2976007 RepID=UPI002E3488D8|nr:SAF domain-containing protein [Spirillospora sp. NBC_01491]
MSARAAHLRRPLAALFAASAAAFALTVLEPGPAASVRVLAAARDLPGGTRLKAADVRPLFLPPGSVPAGALRSRVVGRVLAGPMRRGEPLTDARFVGGGLLKGYGPETVATPVRIADASAVRLVRTGDRIDVLTAPPRSDQPLAEPPPEDRPIPQSRSDPPQELPADPRPQPPPAPPPTHQADTPRPAATAPPLRTASLVEGRGSARLVVASVPVVAVPRQAAGSADEGALVVLATDRAQAAALAGAGPGLSFTITGHW